MASAAVFTDATGGVQSTTSTTTLGATFLNGAGASSTYVMIASCSARCNDGVGEIEIFLDQLMII